jgi:hypothetical protein
MTETLHGIARGNHTEISQDIGVPDGEESRSRGATV